MPIQISRSHFISPTYLSPGLKLISKSEYTGELISNGRMTFREVAKYNSVTWTLFPDAILAVCLLSVSSFALLPCKNWLTKCNAFFFVQPFSFYLREFKVIKFCRNDSPDIFVRLSKVGNFVSKEQETIRNTYIPLSFPQHTTTKLPRKINTGHFLLITDEVNE